MANFCHQGISQINFKDLGWHYNQMGRVKAIRGMGIGTTLLQHYEPAKTAFSFPISFILYLKQVKYATHDHPDSAALPVQ
jgi:hypothetical protein